MRQSPRKIIVGLVLLGVVAATTLMVLNSYRLETSSCCKDACIANMRQIKGAKATWAFETKETYADPWSVSLFNTNYEAHSQNRVLRIAAPGTAPVR